MDSSTGQLMDLGTERNLVDAELILEDFRRAKRFKGKDQFTALLRLANKSLVTFWETPRLPYPKFTHNKPHCLLWSEAARDIYFSGEAINARLILEHIYPTDLKAKLLLELIDVTVCTPEDMLKWIQDTYSGISLTVITKDEDRLLEGKYRAVVTEDGDVWGRYKAVGILTDSFLPLTEDTRYATQVSVRGVNNGKKSAKVK